MDTSNETCIRVGCVTYMPHMIVTGNYVSGTLLEFFEAAGKKLGRCIQYVIEPSNEPGLLLPNGSFTGLVGKAQRKEVDVTTMLLLSLDRSYAVDYSEFLYIEEYSAGYKRPVLGSDIRGFMKPFSLWVWLGAGVTIASVIFSLLFLGLVRQKILHLKAWQEIQDPLLSLNNRNPYFKKYASETADVRSATMWTLWALVGQAVPLSPPNGALRVLIGLWLLLTLILTTVYKSNLKAMLILPNIVLPFNNVEQLSYSNLPLLVFRNSLLHEAIKLAEKNSTLGRLHSLLYQEGVPTDVVKVIKELHLGIHVISVTRTALAQILHLHFSETGECSVYLMSESFLKNNAGILFFQKGSPLKVKFDPIIQNWREFGILDRLSDRAIANASYCLKPVSFPLNSFRPFNVEDFWGTFAIYICGAVLATAAMVAEVCLRPTSRIKTYPVSS